MPTTLSTDELIKSLSHGRHIAPLMVDEGMIDEMIAQITQRRITLLSDSDECLQLKSLLREAGLFVSDARKNTLNTTSVYVLPLNICTAFGDFDAQDRPIIVISQGMIDLVASTILLANLGGQLPKALESFFMPQFRKDMDASSLITNALFIMQVHHYRYGKPLPNFYELLPLEALHENAIAINGALTFILLHELGHHELGHMESENEPSSGLQTKLLIPENLSDYQQQELEADRFAMDSLIEEARVIGTFWQQHAMAFTLQLEIISGLLLSDGHPMALNRAYHSDTLRNDWGKVTEVAHQPEHFEGLANRFEATRAHKLSEVNALLNTPYESCIQILKEANEVCKPLGLDLSSLWRCMPKSWLDCAPDIPNNLTE